MFLICAMTKLGAALLCIADGLGRAGCRRGILEIRRALFRDRCWPSAASRQAWRCSAMPATGLPRPHGHAAAAANSVHVELEDVDLDDVNRARHRDREFTSTRRCGSSATFRSSAAAFPARLSLRRWLFDRRRPRVQAGLPKWLVIALGTVLVIGGSLLFRRERSRPRALKAFTIAGPGRDRVHPVFVLQHALATRCAVARSRRQGVGTASTSRRPTSQGKPRSARRTTGLAARPMARAKKPLERSLDRATAAACRRNSGRGGTSQEPAEPAPESASESAPAQASPVEPRRLNRSNR